MCSQQRKGTSGILKFLEMQWSGVEAKETDRGIKKQNGLMNKTALKLRSGFNFSCLIIIKKQHLSGMGTFFMFWKNGF